MLSTHTHIEGKIINLVSYDKLKRGKKFKHTIPNIRKLEVLVDEFYAG